MYKKSCSILLVVCAFAVLSSLPSISWSFHANKRSEYQAQKQVQRTQPKRYRTRAVNRQRRQAIRGNNQYPTNYRQSQSGSRAYHQPASAYRDFAQGTPSESQALDSYQQDLKTYWRKGIFLETDDRSVIIKLGGDIHADFSTIKESKRIQGSALGELESGFEFRRTRILIAGSFHNSILFKAEYDFSKATTKVNDLFLGIKFPNLATILLGHVKEPFGYDALMSSSSTVFMERGLPVGVFAPQQNIGALAYGDINNKKATWAVGVFKDSNSISKGSENRTTSVTGRVTFLPIYKGEGRQYLHVGAALSKRVFEEDEDFSFVGNPEAHNIIPEEPLLGVLDTGGFFADSAFFKGFEAAFNSGPLYIQGEYIIADVVSPQAQDPTFSGYYLTGAYLLTGETRNYLLSRGIAGHVLPKRDFNTQTKGFGAVEVAVRMSYVDLDDEGVDKVNQLQGGGKGHGGELTNKSIGINWYLNGNTRLMLNYIHSNLEDQLVNGDLSVVSGRLQVNF